MNRYSIPNAIIFLKERYGAENMPTSEETLRRAVRTKDLRVQEDGEPGCKGYTILEEDLIAYGDRRMERVRARMPRTQGEDNSRKQGESPRPFAEVYRKYMDQEISAGEYFLQLHLEKGKWEEQLLQKKQKLVELDLERSRVESELSLCQSAVEAYSDGIYLAKKQTAGGDNEKNPVTGRPDME